MRAQHGSRGGQGTLVPPQGQQQEPAFSAEEVARMVVDARTRVVRTASGHPRFTGLSPDDVEELFDATSEIVVHRADSYASADHVGASLWTGMELRARELFRRRRRRGIELVREDLDDLIDDLDDHEERIAQEQELLVVADFLAALAPVEASVWRLVHGDELSILATAKRLGLSRHAVGEHLDAATRKLETFVALREAGVWCGRRQADITRLVDGARDEGTARRALAHLDACAVCRRAYAARVREAGRIAAGVLPVPALVASGQDAGRDLLDRVTDWLPALGGGSGRMEALGAALLGGGGLAGVAKVGAVVATTATVAVGAGSVVGPQDGPQRADRSGRASIPAAAGARTTGAAQAPAPIAVVTRRAAPVAAASAKTTSARRSSTRMTSSGRRARDRQAEVQDLGAVEPAPATPVQAAAAPPAPVAPTSAPTPAPTASSRTGQESFLP